MGEKSSSSGPPLCLQVFSAIALVCFGLYCIVKGVSIGLFNWWYILGAACLLTTTFAAFRVYEGVRNIASVCLQIGYPTLASVPHSVINGYKRVLAVAVETDYSFPLAEKVKAYLADPTAFAVAAPNAEVKSAAKEEAPKDEPEESDGDMGFGLFD
ncbi:60S acidic ribosomal protein P0-like [Xyrauchen texanus]|uniref:60S acidic ribosomal protein P0-like n=1 Tax=Xyrauchen texanus TaxID=154827 RepID=UPI002242A7C7|nr:60S acidic ribosomal protein P0-like [Xyrauchen texanus]